MTIMKQLIESMITGYLEEDYEDNLVESIFEEVSEETWEAIEEAILNELSPETIDSYKKKAGADRKRAYDRMHKAKSDAAKAIGIANAPWETKDSVRRHHRDKAARHTEIRDRAEKRSKKRTSGLQMADFKTLPADEFERKYRMTKAEWKHKNK